MRNTVGRRATRMDAKQQATNACLQKEVKYYERQAGCCSTGVSSERDRGKKGDLTGSEGGGPNEPEKKFDRKE